MASPESPPPSRPALAAAAHDLRGVEFAELDAILAQVPEPLEPLDAVMLDGFLAGVIVQPTIIEPERWLPYVFDAGGHRWGEAEPGPEQRRARELILRRHVALNRTLAESGGFEPFILEAGPDPQATAGSSASSDPVGAALAPWISGLAAALDLFPGLEALADDQVNLTLAQLLRWLPAAADPAPAAVSDAADPAPVADSAANPPVSVADSAAPPDELTSPALSALDAARLDAAIAEVVAGVADLYDLTAPLRYKVEPVRRDAPKVGRNAACPCGSGRKFKLCHGSGS